MNKLELVKEWRRTFGLPVSDEPCVLSAEQLRLHAKLISDEADEIDEVFSLGGVIDDARCAAYWRCSHQQSSSA